jgi:hypothetical protein
MKHSTQRWEKRCVLIAISLLVPVFLITCDTSEDEHPFQGITFTAIDSVGRVIIEEDPDDWRLSTRPKIDEMPGMSLGGWIGEIDPCFPNPATESTSIFFALACSSHVSIQIIDRHYSDVKTISDEGKNVGYYRLVWHLDDDQGLRVPDDTYRCKYKWYSIAPVDSVGTLVEVYGYGDIRVE